MNAFGKSDYTRHKLDSLRFAIEDRTYTGVLSALETGISEAKNRLDDIPDLEYDSWRNEEIVDEECEIIENLLGAAYVVCQIQITSITNRALLFRSDLQSKGFHAFGDRKEDVRSLGLPLPEHNVTAIEALWALANYFKHREEWPPRDWNDLRGLQGKTARPILELGLQKGSSGNLRAGAKALGNSSFSDMSAFIDHIDTWGFEIYLACKREFSTKNRRV